MKKVLLIYLLCFVGILVILNLGLDKISTLNSIIYFVTGVIVFHYTLETSELRKSTERHTSELQRQEGTNRLLELEKLWVSTYSSTPKTSEEEIKILNFFEILAHAYNRNIIEKHLTMTYFATTIVSEWKHRSEILGRIRKMDSYSYIELEGMKDEAIKFLRDNPAETI